MGDILTKEEEKILSFIGKNSAKYYNIKDISNEIKISYPTTLKHIEILARLGYLKIVQVGNNKICRLNGE